MAGTREVPEGYSDGVSLRSTLNTRGGDVADPLHALNSIPLRRIYEPQLENRAKCAKQISPKP